MSVPDTDGSVAHLDLDAGAYVIVAKAWFTNAGIGASHVSCGLTAGSDSDRSEFDLTGASLAMAVPFVLVHAFSSPGRVDLICRDGGGVVNVRAYDVKITAIKVANLTSSEQL